MNGYVYQMARFVVHLPIDSMCKSMTQGSVVVALQLYRTQYHSKSTIFLPPVIYGMENKGKTPEFYKNESIFRVFIRLTATTIVESRGFSLS